MCVKQERHGLSNFRKYSAMLRKVEVGTKKLHNKKQVEINIKNLNDNDKH